MTQNDIDNRLQALLIEPSNKKIEKDISAYERRLNKARQRLDALPPKSRIPAEDRKLKQTRQQLEGEIGHIRRPIGDAEGASNN